MPTYIDPQIYINSVTAANRRDVPYYSNTTGTVIDGGATGVLDWAVNNDRRAWGRIENDGDLYYDIEVLTPTSLRVYRVNKLGDMATEDFTVSAGTSYDTLVHGVTVPLNSSLTPGDRARVYPGIFVLDSNSMYVERGSAGDSDSGYVHNPSPDVTLKESYLVIGRGTWFENTAGTPLASFGASIPNPIVDTYAVTISNGTSSGKKYTFTGGIGPPVVVDNCAAATEYNIGSTGLRFRTPNSLPGNTDTATAYVDGLADAMELAPDNAGVPGTWVTWDDSEGVRLPLNTPGEDDRQIPPGQSIKFWYRCNPASDHQIGRGVFRVLVDAARAE